jgi:hypothetical protein
VHLEMSLVAFNRPPSISTLLLISMLYLRLSTNCHRHVQTEVVGTKQREC